MIDGDHLPTLHAQRVSLRCLTHNDVDALYTIFSDPEVMRYWSSPPLPDRAAAEALLADIHRCFADRVLFQWGVALAESGEVIGTCTLNHLDADNGRAEVGFALGRRWQGNGYIHEALSRLFDWVFGELGFRRLEADIDPRNLPSVRTVERLGFVREGLLRERWRVNGEVQDSVWYGLLAREWTTPRPPPALKV